MFELFRLIGRVIVDTAGADSAIGKTTQNAMDSADRINGYLGKIKDFVSAAVYAIESSAITKALKEVWDISSQVAEAGDNIDKASQNFLMSAQAYQEWDYIAKMSGTTIESVGAAVYELSKKVAEGGDETLALLEEIGVSAADAMTATPEDLFSMVVAGLQNVEDIGRRAYISDALMGGSAQELETIFNSTQKALEDLVAKQKELGGVMSEELRKMSADFTDAKTNMTEAWDGVKYHLAENTLPGMTKIVDGMTQMLTGDFKGGLETAAEGTVDYLTALLESFSNFSKGIRTAIEESLDIDFSPVLDNPVFNPFAILGEGDRNKELDAEMDQWNKEVEAAGGLSSYMQDYFSGALDNWKSWRNKTFGMGGYSNRAGKYANGLDFVPRDDFPARLHYGEQVLTKQEADDYRAGKASGGNITINITTTQQSPAQTAAAVAAALTRARWAM